MKFIGIVFEFYKFSLRSFWNFYYNGHLIFAIPHEI